MDLYAESKSNVENHFYNKLLLTEFKIADLPELVARSMEKANTYKGIERDEQIQMVSEVLLTVINNMDKTDEKKAAAIKMLNELIETVMIITVGTVKQTVDPTSRNLKIFADQLFDEIKSGMSKEIKHLSMNVVTIVHKIATIKLLKGSDRKQVALHVVDRMLADIVSTSDETALQIKQFRKTVPSLIDTTVSISKGKITIHGAVMATSGLLSLLAICCSKKK